MDKREQILQRLEDILVGKLATTGSGIQVWRNRAELDEKTELPAYVLLDGSETKQDSIPANRMPGAQIMLLGPQIFWVPVPPRNQLNDNLGPDTSQRRSDLVKAIMGDGILRDLLGANGYVEYRGLTTDLATGAEVKGQFQTDWMLAYVLDFNKL